MSSSKQTTCPAGLDQSTPAWRLASAITIVGDWLSIYTAADRQGKGPRATYLMTRFLGSLTELLGKDDEAFLRADQKAKLITQDNNEWKFVFDGYAYIEETMALKFD